MNMTTQSVLVGLVAGLASALLMLGGGGFSALSVILSLFATLPVLIAGLGWSNAAGSVAVASAFAIVAVTVSPLAAAMLAVTTLVPAAWIAHLANLARPAEELGGPTGQLAWYPLSDMMLHLCSLVTLSLIILGIASGYGEELVGEILDVMNVMFQEQGSEIAFDASDREDWIATMARLLPAAQAMIWVTFLFFSWYLASAIVRVSGRSKRPADDIPASLRMSRLAILIFGAGLLISFANGPIGWIGSALSGAFAGGFILSGLAMLHYRTRGRPWRPIVLWFAYLAIILFTVPLVFFLIIGLLETARNSPLTKSGPPNTPTQ